MNSSVVERSGELTVSTADSGASLLDEPIAADVSLSVPRGFGTMRWLQSRGSLPNNGLLAIRQLQPTKLKKISRKKTIIIAAVAVPVAIIVFYQVALKRGIGFR